MCILIGVGMYVTTIKPRENRSNISRYYKVYYIILCNSISRLILRNKLEHASRYLQAFRASLIKV